MGSEEIDQYAMRSFTKREELIDAALESITRCEQICSESRRSNTTTILQLLFEYSEVEVKARDQILLPVTEEFCGRSMTQANLQMCNEIDNKFQIMKKNLINFGQQLEQASDIVIKMTTDKEMVLVKRNELAKMIIEDRMELVQKFQDETENTLNWKSVLDNLKTEWENKKVTINSQIEQCVELVTALCNGKNNIPVVTLD